MTETLEADAGYDDLDDDLLVDDRRRRPGKLTVVLAALIVVAGAFGVGVLVQKHYGGASTAGGLPSGFPSGQTPGGGQFPGGGREGSSTPAATPVVVGTVTKVAGKSITVKNFGGKSVAVTLTDETTVTVTGGTALEKGQSASVAGDTADDGDVTATSVTATTPS